jgi:hypothetical protein
MGTVRLTSSIASAVGASRASVCAIGPGATAFTLIPSGPHSMASTRVSMSTPALAAQTWDCSAIGRNAWGADAAGRAGLVDQLGVGQVQRRGSGGGRRRHRPPGAP